MMTEWLKVMLDEIVRKKAEAEAAAAEELRRRGEQERPETADRRGGDTGRLC
jgi:hypothetical protein